MCLRSGRKTDSIFFIADSDFPSPGKIERRSRRVMERNVSMIGSPRTRNGTMSEKAADPLVELWIERMASVNPRKRLPESPRKIRALLKLYRRNPSTEPPRTSAIVAVARSPFMNEIVKIVSETMQATPDARPSRPSIRLNAFVTPTIQSSVTGKSRMPRLNRSALNGWVTTEIRNPADRKSTRLNSSHGYISYAVFCLKKKKKKKRRIN